MSFICRTGAYPYVFVDDMPIGHLHLGVLVCYVDTIFLGYNIDC